MAANETDESLDSLSYFSLSCSLFLIVIAMIGLFGNAISIAIYLQRQFRQTSINIFLASLSMADFFMILLSIPVFAVGPLMTFAEDTHKFEVLYSYCVVYVYPFTSIFHCCSIWLLMAVTGERWLAVCRPLQMRTYSTRTRVLAVIVAIVLLSIAYNLVRFWEFEIVDNEARPLLRDNKSFFLWYITVGHFFTSFVIPLGLMITLNSQIAKELVKADNHRKHMTASERADCAVAKMLLYVVLTFICCYSYSMLVNLFETLKPDLFTTSIGYALSDVNNVMVTLNAASTFLFYVKFGSRYRLKFKFIVSRVCCPCYYQRLLTRQRLFTAITKVSQGPALSHARAPKAPKQRWKTGSVVSLRGLTNMTLTQILQHRRQKEDLNLNST